MKVMVLRAFRMMRMQAKGVPVRFEGPRCFAAVFSADRAPRMRRLISATMDIGYERSAQKEKRQRDISRLYTRLHKCVSYYWTLNA